VADTDSAAFADRRRVQANSFGGAASVYERARPGYPDVAIDWLLPSGNPQVVDLGAGTGKLTRLIAARNVEVTAIDPSVGMLEQLRQGLPTVPALQGAAEQLPLHNDSFDAVLVGQAWHWVDVARASAEVARVLRPGGRLGLVWNHRDERVDWVRELTEIVSAGVDHAGSDPGNPEFGPEFGQIEYLVTEWRSPMTPAGLLELVASRSYFIVAAEPDQRAITTAIRDLLERHPQLAGRDLFDLPYVTYASRAHTA
jgi:SAM-dependent methyltransferase